MRACGASDKLQVNARVAYGCIIRLHEKEEGRIVVSIDMRGAVLACGHLHAHDRWCICVCVRIDLALC